MTTTFTPEQVNAAARANDVEAGDGPWHVRFLRELGLTMEPECPALPGTPGSIIANVETDYDATYEHAVLHEDGNWWSPEEGLGYGFIRPENITAWIPARVVPVAPDPGAGHTTAPGQFPRLGAY